MSWSNSYIGLPWLDRGRTREGVDCWGLIRLPFMDVHGIELPSYLELYATAQESAEIAAAMDRRNAPPWLPVITGQEQSFDVGVFRKGQFECHVGLVVEPGLMLHIETDGQSHVARYREQPWRNKLIGFNRHEALA